MGKFYSPNGNPEVWDEKPNNYFTEEEWLELHPQEAYVPTTEEQLNNLDMTYENEKNELIRQYNDDIMHQDTQAANEDINAMQELDAWYDEEYSKIKNEEN